MTGIMQARTQHSESRKTMAFTHQQMTGVSKARAQHSKSGKTNGIYLPTNDRSFGG